MQYYQKIRNRRENTDWKQYEFANLINVLPKTYNLYENGLREIPWSTLSRILRKLNLSLDYVLELSDQITYPNLKKINIDLISENLKKYRKKMRLSQKEMAKLLNCRQQTLSGYETRKLNIPIGMLQKFCEITKISADTITGRTEKVRIVKKIPTLN